MTVVDEPLLAAVRRQPCVWCGWKRGLCEAAHVFGRGHGGGRRLDVSWNVLSLCPVLVGNGCHWSSHNRGRPNQLDLVAIAAQIEGTSQDAIECAVYSLRRLPNRATQRLIDAEMESLPEGARKLVRKILEAREAA